MSEKVAYKIASGLEAVACCCPRLRVASSCLKALVDLGRTGWTGMAAGAVVAGTKEAVAGTEVEAVGTEVVVVGTGPVTMVAAVETVVAERTYPVDPLGRTARSQYSPSSSDGSYLSP